MSAAAPAEPARRDIDVSQTYLGDRRGARPRRVVSIPQSQLVRLVVGGRPAQLDAVRCPAVRG